MTRLNKLTLLAAAVALSVGLSACGGGGSSTTAMPEPEPMPEPMPDPGPTDLETTVQAARDAAAAAATAAGNADTAASAAEAAAASLATLQTGADADADKMGGRESATASRAEANAAMAASEQAAAAAATAAAATTGDAAEAAWRMAENAKDAAEAAAMKAGELSTAAIAAAMTELHIMGTVKTVGASSVDASSGMLTSPTGDKVTGFIGYVSRAADAVEGQHFIQNNGAADEVKYKQAIASGSVSIGKMVDTSDDKARLTIVDSYHGSKNVRVFVDGNGEATNATLDGMLGTTVTGLAGFPLADTDTTTDGNQFATVESIGIYYLANDRADADLPAATEVEGDPSSDTGANVANALSAYDRVSLTDGGEPHEIFEISDGTNTHHVRVVETITDDQGVTARHYQPVDIVANASMTDGDDLLGAPDNLSPVTVSIPAATKYSHIHFGVWAGLGAANAVNGSQELASLGIGFVQNYDDSGITRGHVTGTATYNGDWVAAVRREFASRSVPAPDGDITMYDGHATLIANFSEDEFTGDLDGLATLEGALTGNTFAGTKATVEHGDLDEDGTFAGSFSGAIYGDKGAEAAGVFSFDGGDAGAFVGAFGGRDVDQ